MTTVTSDAAHMTTMLTDLFPNAPIVLLDMDGVFVDWGNGLNRQLLKHDPNYPIVPVGQQLDYNHLSGPGGDPEILAAAMNAPGLYRDLEPMPYAVDAVLEMEKAGLNVFFCTKPFLTHATCASEKLASVEAHLGKRWVDRVILTHDKTLVRGDILIDDHPDITGAMTPTWTQVVYDHSYNRVPRLAHLPRLTGWRNWESVIYPALDMASIRA